MLVVVGNRDTPRCARLTAALARSALAWRWVEWIDALTDVTALTRGLCAGDTVRVESPGQRRDVELALLALGADAALPPRAQRVDRDALAALPDDRGRVVAPAQWYAGFRRALTDLDRAVRDVGAGFVSAPDAIATMFDKRATHATLAAAGVATTASLGAPDTWDALRTAMRDRGVDRVFVKLAHASSASGAVALSLRTGSPQALTTVEMVRVANDLRVYNSRRVRLAQGDAARAVTSWVLDQGAQVERWHPKARVADGEFDLRVVCIGGVARHHVARVSRAPMTNLHLGNARMQPDELAAAVPAGAVDAVKALAARAAKAFPTAGYCGVDALLSPAFDDPRVIEVNAFGDLLPGTLDGGVETHDAELMAVPR